MAISGAATYRDMDIKILKLFWNLDIIVIKLNLFTISQKINIVPGIYINIWLHFTECTNLKDFKPHFKKYSRYIAEVRLLMN
jgi:hypothetical protein